MWNEEKCRKLIKGNMTNTIAELIMLPAYVHPISATGQPFPRKARSWYRITDKRRNKLRTILHGTHSLVEHNVRQPLRQPPDVPRGGEPVVGAPIDGDRVAGIVQAVTSRVGGPVGPQVVPDAAVEPPEPARVDLGEVQHGHGGGARRGVVEDAGKQSLD